MKVKIMALLQRESPKDKKVSLFVTCIVDMIYPNTGMSVVDILESIDIQVDFPAEQTCCGQPGFNAGHRDDAKAVAKQFLKAFKDAEVIVTPSGSCAAMVRHDYPTLFTPDDGDLYEQAIRMASITWEFTEFLVEGLGMERLDLKLLSKETFAIHDACHGLRNLGLGQSTRRLVQNMGNAELVELNECDVCCGFGGLFSVKMPEISNAMLKNKVENINVSQADTIITGDVSCMTQMNGGLSRNDSNKRVMHIAEVLAKGLKGDNS
jgi:L-lactate dehydrogenase complex protein LldE